MDFPLFYDNPSKVEKCKVGSMQKKNRYYEYYKIRTFVIFFNRIFVTIFILLLQLRAICNKILFFEIIFFYFANSFLNSWSYFKDCVKQNINKTKIIESLILYFNFSKTLKKNVHYFQSSF